MIPDIKTLMLLYLITNVISAGAMAVIWSQSRGRFAGIYFWLVDMILQAVGSALIVLRGLVPDLISMVLANAMIQAGALIIFIGLERFTGKKGLQIHNYILLAVFIAVSAYFVVVQPNLTARDIAISAMLMIYTFQCCWLLQRRVDSGMRIITRLTGIVFAVYAAFNFARIILLVIFPTQTSDFYKSGAVNALAITGYILLNLCLTISLVLMVNRQLLADVRAQEEKLTTAFRSSPYAIMLTRSSDGTIFEVNDGFVNIMGYQYGEAIGKSTLDLQLWVNREDRLAVVNELAQGREIHGVEYQFRNKTGKVLTGLFSASQVTINNETCILSSIDDITERKQAEEALRISENTFTLLFENSPEYTYRISLEGIICDINNAALEALGYDRDDIVGKPLMTIYAPESLPKARELLGKWRKTGNLQNEELVILSKNGGRRTILLSVGAVRDIHENILHSISVQRDITERKKAEEALRESEEQYRLLADNMRDQVWLMDLNLEPTYISPSVEKIRGYTLEELAQLPLDKQLTATSFQSAMEYFSIELPKALADPTYSSGPLELEFYCKDGSTLWTESEFTLIWDENGKPLSLLGVATDITERKQLQLKLEESATHDALTGLPNRRLLYDRFDVALANAQRKKKKLAIMSLDLDKFKAVNDTLGHDVGDKLLVAAAGLLTSILRKVDTVARIGGDEFVLLLWDVDHKEDAVKVAQKVVEEFRRPFSIDGHTLNNTVSLGVAIYPEDGKDIKDLLKNSDESLYRVKDDGRNNYQFSP